MAATYFLFATGIESSCPTIDNGRTRIDQLDACDHYRRWREDLELARQLGVGWLRCGPPILHSWRGARHFDWEFADEYFAELIRLRIQPIVDLCHFGVPDWLGNFQNPDFPELFAAYAAAFARRFPHVQLYTPVNEMYICALFSARYGWWNEQLRTDRGFVTALKHLVGGNVRAMEEIRAIRADALFVQSESSEYSHAKNPAAIPQAQRLNQVRFLSLDLNYGRRVNSDMYEYLLDNGLTREEYRFFMQSHRRHFCILGNDYYATNEHMVMPDGSTSASGEIFGYHVITSQYYERYRLPVMHTETNAADDGKDSAVRWLRKQWANVLRVRNDGVPIIGFTWYSLLDQVDWDVALREKNGRVNSVGLYDLQRRPRAVGTAYQEMIEEWRDVLPTQSIVLALPLADQAYPPPALPPDRDST